MVPQTQPTTIVIFGASGDLAQEFAHNIRWNGVPFYLRIGKSLSARVSEIVVEFQCPPHLMFNLPPRGVGGP